MLKSFFTITLVILSLCGNSQTSKSEEAPAIKRVKEVIEIINSYNPQKAEKYIQENFTPEYLKNSMERNWILFAGLYDESRKLKTFSIDTLKSFQAMAICKAELTEDWRQITVGVEPKPPYRIRLINQRVSPAPQGEAEKLKQKIITNPDKELDLFIRRLEKAELFSGNVLVAHDGKIVFHKTYGEASKEFKIPNQLNTKFIVGSINKMFTATGILQLIEQQKLSMEDSVSRFLPDVLSKNIAGKIKIKHLLTHTSGLGDFLFTAEMSQKSKDNYRTIADYLPTLADDTLLFEPGAQWRYSNTGFLVLGAIIEKISGMSYYDFMHKNVYEPAGMTETVMPELDSVNHGLADTYDKYFISGRPVFYNNKYVQVIKGTPAGGGFSTAPDLFRFTQAIANGKLLKPETVRLMQSPKPEMNSPNYGFGTQIFDSTTIGHTGGGPGTQAMVRINPAKGLTIIVLGNTNGGTSTVGRKIRELYVK